jgi:hypothetical protein
MKQGGYVQVRKNAYINVPRAEIYSTNFSISMDIRLLENSGQPIILADWTKESSSFMIAYGASCANSLGATLRSNDSSPRDLVGTSSPCGDGLPLNSWVNLVIDYDRLGRKLSLYYDGKIISQTVSTYTNNADSKNYLKDSGQSFFQIGLKADEGSCGALDADIRNLAIGQYTYSPVNDSNNIALSNAFTMPGFKKIPWKDISENNVGCYLGRYPVTTCAEACASNMKCLAFNWIRPLTQGGEYGCCLKLTDDSNKLIESPNTDFFIKEYVSFSNQFTMPGFTKIPAIDIVGFDISCHVGSPVIFCSDACATNPKCLAFNWVKPVVDSKFGNWGASYGCCLKLSNVTSQMASNPNVDFFVKNP